MGGEEQVDLRLSHGREIAKHPYYSDGNRGRERAPRVAVNSCAGCALNNSRGSHLLSDLFRFVQCVVYTLYVMAQESRAS